MCIRDRAEPGPAPVPSAAEQASRTSPEEEAVEGQGSEIDRAVARLNADRERLEGRLTALSRENRRLKTSLATLDAPANGASGAAQRDGELREQMSDLAAEVVHLAAMLEGPDSPITKALAVPEEVAVDQGAARMRSLADRVRALQKATAPE